MRINTISPGPVPTARWFWSGGVAATVAAATGVTPDTVAEEAANGSVTGRFTRPEEVADLVSSEPSARVDKRATGAVCH